MAPDDDFWSSLGAQPATPASGSKPATAPSSTGSDDDAFWSSLGTGKQDAGGTTQEQPRKPWWQAAADYAGGVVGSFTHGLSFGLDNPLDRATAALFPNSAFAQLQPQREQQQQQFQQTNPVVAGTAEVAGSIPTYMMGEGALRAAVPVVQSSGIIGTGANLVGSAARNALMSGAQAAGTTEGSVADRLEAAKQGAITGAIVGPGADVAGTVVGKALGVGGDVSAADASLGKLARDKYDIPITAADMSSNQVYRTAADQASKLPFSGASAANAAKQAAWQGAIASEMGENATAFTDDVMQRAKTRIGQTFDGIENRTTIDQPTTNNLINNLSQIEADATRNVPASQLNPVKARIDDVLQMASQGNGTISGAAYKSLTNEGSALARLTKNPDPEVRNAAEKITDALDTAFASSASPADQAAFAQAKYQWRVMKTVQDLAAGSRDGNISPDAFMQKVVTASRRFDSPTGGIAYTGGGNIGELAKIGKLMRAAPDSGTAARTVVNALALGGTAGPAFLNPAYMAAVPAALTANRLGGAYLRSGAAANRVIEGALSPGMYRPSQVIAPGAAAIENRLRSNPVQR